MARTNLVSNNIRVLWYCGIVGLGSILFGIDQGINSGFLAMQRFLMEFGYYDSTAKAYSITADSVTLLFGVQLAFIIIACVLSGPIGTRYGRKTGLGLCAAASIIGPAIQAGSNSYAVLVVGRAFGGLGVGWAANFVIMYWSEVAPAELRGLIVLMYQALINVAQFVGSAVNEGTNHLDNDWAWRGPMMLEILAPLLLLAFLFIIPETPRWFVTRGREEDAKKAMGVLNGPSYSSEEIDREVANVAAFIQMEKELEGSSSFIECFSGTDLRRTLIVIIVLVGQQFTGISFITSYGTYFFSTSGITDAFVVTVIAAACGIAGSLSAFPLVRYFGRRPILIVGAAFCAVSMLVFAAVGTAAPGTRAASNCLVAFTSLYIFTYGATWGPVPQVVLGEVPSNRLRAKTMAIATCANWLCTTIIVCGMPYLLNDDYINLGAKVGFIFGGCSICTTLWTIMYLPETKDRTLEEIDEMFLNKIPTRHFKNYVCTGTVSASRTEDKLEIFEDNKDGSVRITEEIA